MNIAIGADHGGYKLKQGLVKYFYKKGHKVFDVGAFSRESCDYPDFAKRVAKLVSGKKAKTGVLICKSGIGMSMAANRAKGIRAALCQNIKMVKAARQHNNANILVLGSRFTNSTKAKRMIGVFIKEEFSGGRHIRRVRKIDTK